MSDSERDQIDLEAKEFIRLCSEKIRRLQEECKEGGRGGEEGEEGRRERREGEEGRREKVQGKGRMERRGGV